MKVTISLALVAAALLFAALFKVVPSGEPDKLFGINVSWWLLIAAVACALLAVWTA